MKTLHNLLLTFFLAYLYGCSATDTDETNNAATEERNDTEIIVSENTRLTSELSSDPYFTFKTSHSIMLDFSWSAMGQQRSYLSICQEATENPDGSWSIDYESCLLRAPVTDGVFQGEIEITNDRTVLYAELWSYDATTPPLRMKFTTANSAQETWNWNQ